MAHYGRNRRRAVQHRLIRPAITNALKTACGGTGALALACAVEMQSLQSRDPGNGVSMCSDALQLPDNGRIIIHGYVLKQRLHFSEMRQSNTIIVCHQQMLAIIGYWLLAFGS